MTGKFAPAVYRNELETGHWPSQVAHLHADLASIHRELVLHRWILIFIIGIETARLILLVELLTR